MKLEQMVGTRLPSELVRALELIEDVEQSDRSTTVRRLLSKAIHQWKLEHYARLFGERKLTLARAARGSGRVPMGNDGLRPRIEGAVPIRPRRPPSGSGSHSSKRAKTIEASVNRYRGLQAV